MDYTDFDLRQLEAFAAVVSAGSMTSAAQVLGRSQPAMTRAIQDLETALGYRLFHRSGPRISPTEQGVLFHAEVERMLVGFQHIRERARAIGQGEPRPIEIAATPALSVGLVPAALAALDPALLPRSIHVQALSAENVVQSLLARAVDLGVASLPVEHPGIDVHWTGEAPCVAVVPENDPLARGGPIALSALAGRRIITMANPYRLRHRIEEAMAEAGLVPASVIDTNASQTALALARAGLGIAIIEPATALGLVPEGLTLMPVAPGIPFLFGVLSPAAKPLSPTIMAVVEALLDVARTKLPGFRLHETGRAEPIRSRSGSADGERFEA
jgi:DNA-binding transcriptional LysR family regulator